MRTPKIAFRENYPNWAYDSSWNTICMHFWPGAEINSAGAGSMIDVVGGQNITEAALMGASTHDLNGGFLSTNTPTLENTGSSSFLFVAAVVASANTAKITYGNISTGQGFAISSAAGGGITVKGSGGTVTNNASSEADEVNVGNNIIIGYKNKTAAPDEFSAYWGADGTDGVASIDISSTTAITPTAEIKVPVATITGIYGMAMFSGATLVESEAVSLGRYLGAQWIAGNKVIPGADFSEWYRSL